jgi:RNA polymerase sigma factor (sigma-70 family)
MLELACDSTFLDGFRRGERKVLARVYSEHVEEVERFVRSFFTSDYQKHRLASRSVDLEDLVQEIFTRAFSQTARLSFDVQRPYGPFLGALARNLVVDWARRRCPEIPTEDIERYAANLNSAADVPWADGETIRLVDDYVARLNPELREIHELRYVLNHTQEEACRALGLSRQQLRTREKHLRDGLRRALKRAELGSGGSLVAGVNKSD